METDGARVWRMTGTKLLEGQCGVSTGNDGFGVWSSAGISLCSNSIQGLYSHLAGRLRSLQASVCLRLTTLVCLSTCPQCLGY